MNFDRNTVLGFVILGLLFFGYFYYNNKEQADYLRRKTEQARVDSINKSRQQPPVDTIALKRDSTHRDSVNQVVRLGQFASATHGDEDVVTVKTRLFTAAFTNKGGQLKWVDLNGFRNKDSLPVRLGGTDFDNIGYPIATAQGQVAQTSELYFQRARITTNPDSTTTVSFVLKSADSSSTESITHQYIVRPADYMIDFSILVNGAAQLLPQGAVNLSWKYTAAQQESDITFEKRNTQVGFVENGEFDYYTVVNRTSCDFNDSVKWVGVRQRFFNSFLIGRQAFSSGKLEWTVPPDNRRTIVEATASLKATLSATGRADFSLFYGPADYHTLRQYDLKLANLINLGQGMYAFVAPINKYVILPVWDFFKGFVGSFGIVIALLTLFIRLLISPLTYKSYLSGAKMKALRPEIAALKAKFGDDQQAMSMEQMKLFREAGVNPLGGCIPALFQIPIFFALYSFFNANVDLRGADFLWAKDLSAFDDVLKFGVNIPLLGSHLSLFTITAVLTSLAISVYSMSMSPDQSNPVLKYMPYIFPVFLLFIFNTLPSALTWYYTVSNIITLALQFVIQNYIIDHDKVLAKIQENRKKPKTKSKWQERLEQMQDQQKKLKEIRDKGKR